MAAQKPLSDKALQVLRVLAEDRPLPSQEVNAGIAQRLRRDGFVTWEDLTNPYASSQRKSPTCTHLVITHAGRRFLKERERRSGRAEGLREAADDMERVMGFGVMKIPVVGMAKTLRDKAKAVERGEIT